MDYILKPMGKSLIKNPEVMDLLKSQMSSSENSPVLSRAPILLSESLIFPYREGLSFEQDLWMDQGQAAAFPGALDRPPTSSWEIINPREYEKKHVPAVPLMPDIHPLVDKLYKPYDIGQVGQLDIHVLAEIFAGDQAARDLTPAWNGGIYWAGRRLDTPPAEQSTRSLSMFYLSAWKNTASAQAFARLYADDLGRKYSGLKRVSAQAADKLSTPAGQQEQVYSTSEGPVVITTRGKFVFVSESFDLDLARKLTELVLDAQGAGEFRMATTQPAEKQGVPGLAFGTWEGMQSAPQPGAPSFPFLGQKTGTTKTAPETGEPLTSGLVRFLSNCGVMKAVVQAEIKAAAAQ